MSVKVNQKVYANVTIESVFKHTKEELALGDLYMVPVFFFYYIPSFFFSFKSAVSNPEISFLEQNYSKTFALT